MRFGRYTDIDALFNLFVPGVPKSVLTFLVTYLNSFFVGGVGVGGGGGGGGGDTQRMY